VKALRFPDVASIGHIAVGLAAATATWKSRTASGPLGGSMIALSALSLLPDADVIGFPLGVPYGATWGHRGASHSLAAALIVGMFFGLAAWRDSRRRAVGQSAATFGAIVALVVASHGLLDAMTDGGMGVALLWPFTTRRYFFPWQPIPVAPIGAAFFSSWGLRVAAVEMVQFAPLFLYALWPRRPAP
jgi:inner membrane protein